MTDRIEIITVHPYTLFAAIGAVSVILLLSVLVIVLLLHRHRRLMQQDTRAGWDSVWAVAQHIAELREPEAVKPLDARLLAMLAPRPGDRAGGLVLSLTVIVTPEKTTVRIRDGKVSRAETTDPLPSRALAKAEDVLGIVRVRLAPPLVGDRRRELPRATP